MSLSSRINLFLSSHWTSTLYKLLKETKIFNMGSCQEILANLVTLGALLPLLTSRKHKFNFWLVYRVFPTLLKLISTEAYKRMKLSFLKKTMPSKRGTNWTRRASNCSSNSICRVFTLKARTTIALRGRRSLNKDSRAFNLFNWDTVK